MARTPVQVLARAAPGCGNFPRDFAGIDVEGAEEALAGLIGVAAGFVSDAFFEGHEVVEAGVGGEGGGVPIGGVAGAAAGIFDDGTSVGGDARGPIDAVEEGLGEEELAGGPVEDVEEAVAIGMEQEFRGLALVSGVDQDVGFGGVAVFQVVRGELVVPLEGAGLGIEREDAVGVEVVAGAVAVVGVGPGIAGGPEERVGGGIVGAGEPRGAAAGDGFFVAPGGDLVFAALGDGPATPEERAGIGVEGGDEPANALVGSGNTDEDGVVDDERRHGAAVMRIAGGGARGMSQRSLPSARWRASRWALSVTKKTFSRRRATPRLVPSRASPNMPELAGRA